MHGMSYINTKLPSNTNTTADQSYSRTIIILYYTRNSLRPRLSSDLVLEHIRPCCVGPPLDCEGGGPSWNAPVPCGSGRADPHMPRASPPAALCTGPGGDEGSYGKSQ